MSVFKKITALIFAILVFTVSASVIVINVTVTVKSILEPNAPPEIFGYSAIAIADGSSESNKSDSINRGSIAIFKKEKIEIGKNVAYRDSNGAYTVGRVTSETISSDGKASYRVKADSLDGEYLELMTEQTYIGTFYRALPLLGAAVQFSTTLVGQILLVWIPAIIAFIMLIWEIIVSVALRADGTPDAYERQIFETSEEKSSFSQKRNKEHKKHFTLPNISFSGLINCLRKKKKLSRSRGELINVGFEKIEHPTVNKQKSIEGAVHITSEAEEHASDVNAKAAHQATHPSKSPDYTDVTEIKTVKISTDKKTVSDEPVIALIKSIPMPEESIEKESEIASSERKAQQALPHKLNALNFGLNSRGSESDYVLCPERSSEPCSVHNAVSDSVSNSQVKSQIICIEAEDDEENDEYFDSNRDFSPSSEAAVDEAYACGLIPSEHDFTFAKLRKSFLAKLIQSDDEVKEYYSILKNELLSYKQLKSRYSWSVETFKYRRTHIAKMNVKGRTLYLYVALDPLEFENTKYFSHDATGISRYKGTPMMIKIKSERGVRHGIELISTVADMLGLVKNPKYIHIDYKPPYESTMALIEKRLIKDLTGCYKEVQAAVADSLMTDEHAEKLKVEEEVFVLSDKRRRGIVNIDTLSDNFNAGDEITLDKMKQQIRGFDKKMTYVKVLARGTLNKPLTVHADDFSIGAVKMLLLTGGKAVFPKKKQ